MGTKKLITAGITGIAAMALAAITGSANAATITVAGQSFDETAFADTVNATDGTNRLFGAGGSTAPTDLNDALSGSNLQTGANCTSATCAYEALFTDNSVVNEAGDDLIIFGLGDPAGAEIFSISINGTTIGGFDAAATGELVEGTSFDLASVSIDLSDFGIGLGETVSSVLFSYTNATGGSEEFLAFAAINNAVNGPVVIDDPDTPEVPLPAAFYIFAAGAAGLYGAGRKKRD